MLRLLSSTGEDLPLVSKVPYQKAKAGDRLVAFGPSGGGYGNPLTRDPEAVLDDVLDGYITAEFARDHYGVVIANGRVDEAVTAKRRTAGRAD